MSGSDTVVVMGLAYEFRILGPLEVVGEGVAIALGATRARALLALLIVHADEAVSVDKIVDELWGDSSPAQAVHAVQVHVSELRKALSPLPSSAGGPVIETRGRGYRLHVQTDCVDAARFEALASRGRAALAVGEPAVASALLREALGLWRGPVLADLAEFEFASEIGVRLEESRIGALEDRIDAELELGEGSQVVVELESLLHAHPLRERLVSELMIGLYRAGRQVDALRVYERFRRKLGNDLGLEPSPALRELEGAIVRHEPDLPDPIGHPTARRPRDGIAPASPRLPGPLALLAGSGPFVGRLDALDDLNQIWNTAVDSVRLGVVTGEAGIGKSRLVAEFAGRVHGAGAAVLYGVCYEDAAAPYGPLIQVVSSDLEHLEDAEARRRIGDGAADLVGILPGVANRMDVPPGPLSANPDVQRLRLLDAIAGYLERATERERTLIVIEDLQWADVASLDSLRHVVRSGRGGMLVVATCRDVPPDLSDPLARFLADLARHSNVHRLALSGLTETEVVALVRADRGVGAGTDAERLARALYELTDGSPLFVKELLRVARKSDLLRPPLPLSPTLRDVVSARFSQLPATDDLVIDAATVMGNVFEARLLADVMDTGIDPVLDALERAELLSLVEGLPGSPGRFAFTHALFREVRYAQISASRRLRLHQRIGQALARRSTDDAHVPDLAHHFCAAAAIGEIDRAVRFARRAGELARARFAFADAAGYLERAEAAARLASPPDAGLLCDVAIERGEALHRGGLSGYREILLEAAELAQRLDDPQRLAAAALALNEQGWTLAAGYLDDEVHAVTRAALHGLAAEPSRIRARLLAMMAAALNLTALHSQSRELGDAAVVAARRLGDPSTLAEVLVTAHWALFDPENLEERLGIADEVETLSEELGDPVFRLQALLMRAPDLRESGDLHAGNRVARQAAALADELGLPFFRVLGRQGFAAAMEGRLDDAERQATEALARAADSGFDVTAAVYPVLFGVLIDRGRWEELIDALPPLMSGTHGLPAYRAALAMVLARCGRVDEATEHLQRFTATDFNLMPRNIQWAAGMVALADAITHIDDADAAAKLRGLLAPMSGRTPWQDNICIWPIDLALGQLAVVVDDTEAATHHLSAAESMCARNNVPIHLVRCRIHRAWALSRATGSGSAARIRALRDEALASARALGAHGLAREAELFGLID